MSGAFRQTEKTHKRVWVFTWIQICSAGATRCSILVDVVIFLFGLNHEIMKFKMRALVASAVVGIKKYIRSVCPTVFYTEKYTQGLTVVEFISNQNDGTRMSLC